MSAVPRSKLDLPSRRVPTRADQIVFGMKAAAFRLSRRIAEAFRAAPVRHTMSERLALAPIVAHVRSPLWTAAGGPKEAALTAGKVENLRIALKGLDGIEVAAGDVLSFWKQVGKPAARRGFVAGRELREGCLIASTGGGLCQLSNALYEAALKAGFTVVERHAHSRIVPGSRAAAGRDATVFWNYVDLRFRNAHAFRVEARMTATHLELVIRARAGAATTALARDEAPAAAPVRAAADDCQSCEQTGCRMHDPETAAQTARRPTAWLVDAATPEFAALMSARATPFDALHAPLKSQRPRYLWPVERCGTATYGTTIALARALNLRYGSRQGAGLQRLLAAYDGKLARSYAKRLSHLFTHAIVSQSLLPHLWLMGALQGRSFEVLLDRWPMAELQARLDDALLHYPESPTLGDFRASPTLVAAEAAALGAAERLHTPHREIAKLFPTKTQLLDWAKPAPRAVASGGRSILFPASALGRKGAYQLREALYGLDVTLLVAGKARESGRGFWHGIDARPLDGGLPATLAAIVLPAVIEHNPRSLLAGLAAGVPVIATAACGLGASPGVTTVPAYDAAALRRAIVAVLEAVRIDAKASVAAMPA